MHFEVKTSKRAAKLYTVNLLPLAFHKSLDFRKRYFLHCIKQFQHSCLFSLCTVPKRWKDTLYKIKGIVSVGKVDGYNCTHGF